MDDTVPVRSYHRNTRSRPTYHTKWTVHRVDSCRKTLGEGVPLWWWNTRSTDVSPLLGLSVLEVDPHTGSTLFGGWVGGWTVEGGGWGPLHNPRGK